jgi:hypothetical protein
LIPTGGVAGGQLLFLGGDDVAVLTLAPERLGARETTDQ